MPVAILTIQMLYETRASLHIADEFRQVWQAWRGENDHLHFHFDFFLTTLLALFTLILSVANPHSQRSSNYVWFAVSMPLILTEYLLLTLPTTLRLVLADARRRLLFAATAAAYLYYSLIDEATHLQEILIDSHSLTPLTGLLIGISFSLLELHLHVLLALLDHH